MARLLSLGAWKLAGLIQESINFSLQVFNGSEFIGKALPRQQKLLISTVADLLQKGFELLQQRLTQLFQFGQSSSSNLPAVVIQYPLSHQEVQPAEKGRWHLSTPLAGAIDHRVHLLTAVSSGFAPSGEVFAVVEEQVVVLFAKATHRSTQGDSCRGRVGVIHHAQHLALAEL